MPISVTCDRCGHQFDAPEESEDSDSPCPECGETVPVPASSGDAEDEPELRLEPEEPDHAGSDESEVTGSSASQADPGEVAEDVQKNGQEENQRDEKHGERDGVISGRFDLILQSIPVGLKPDALLISVAGVFASTLMAFLFIIFGLQTGSPATIVFFSLIGILLSLSISFETFAAVSHLSTTRLQGDTEPEWSELTTFLFKNVGATQIIPFSLLLGVGVALILEFILGWIGAIPYIGGLFLVILGVVYLLLNVFLLINLVLGMWFTFPIVSCKQSGFIEAFKTLYQRIRDRFLDSIMNLGMVLLLMFAFLWVVVSFCMGAAYMTGFALGSQTTVYVKNTMGQAEQDVRDADGLSFDGNQMQTRQIGGPMQSFFGQFLLALLASILTALVYGPIVSVFFSGGCAVYLSGGDDHPSSLSSVQDTL